MSDSYETRACVECGNGYEAFIFPNGKAAGSGLCPACRENHQQAALAMEPKKKTVLDPAKNGTAWTESAVCKKCRADFDAKYFNVFGLKFGNPRGLCSKCEHEHQQQEAERERIEKERKIKVQRESWRHECGIPGIYLTARFGTWEFKRPGNVDTMFEICKDYAEKYDYLRPRENKSLIIVSHMNGTGKTHMASSIAHRIIDRWQGEEIGRPVTMITEPDLFDRIRASFNRGDDHDHEHETEQEIINIMTRTPLLVLDDLGKQEVADLKFVQRTLFKVINGRYNYGLPVVITTNKNEKELRRYLGGMDGDEATLDRLIEMSGKKFHVISGESYRRK